MPEFQLPVAASLVASAVCSLALYSLADTSQGKVRLSHDVDGELKDPFDVTKPEDLVDGEPINEEAFWAQVSNIHNVA